MIDEFVKAQSSDAVSEKGIKLSLIVTLVLWLVVMIFLACYSPEQKTTYKTVKITLTPTPVEKVEKKVANVPAASAPATEPAPAPNKTGTPAKKSTTQAASKSVQKPTEKQSATKAPSVQKETSSSSQAQKKKNITYKKSVEELMAEQAAASSKSKTWDDSMFDDEDSSSVSSSAATSTNAGKISGSSALSGTAASSAGTQQSVSSVSSNTDSATGVSSSATKSALGKIAATTYTQTAAEGINTKTAINTARASDGKVMVALADGSARILLDPSKPVIMISEENAILIDSSRTVKISFRILAAGNVPLSGISITPSALLPPAVQTEIKEQISKWRFATASDDGHAVFEYSIIKG